jgi:uncharacterized repeat protein (TIGR04076 family)
MEAVQFDRSEIAKLYNQGNDAVKNFLEEKFGKENLFHQVSDETEAVEDACKENGTSWDQERPFSEPKNPEQKCINAFAALIQIVKASRKGGKIDWRNSNQYKWIPWWWMNKESGSGLSFGAAAFGHSNTGVASRLYSLDEATAKSIAINFPGLWEDFMTE